ncbi:MAG: transposase family protein [Leptolyngbyaceae cyanobacterium SU_3_3]|nr:transposase family protein [Leptolyngbyaceae cyanobacterium SU_3_3]
MSRHLCGHRSVGHRCHRTAHSASARHHRSKKSYSGKKHQNSLKNTVISSLRRQILFLGPTVWGSQHDYGLFKSEFPPELNWFARFKVWSDLGYLGFADDFQTLELHIPYKRPRKSKANPTPTLTDEQKVHNRTVSQTRIVVEHVLASLKHWAILTAKFRNHRHNLDDSVIYAAAGLHNFLLNMS